MSIDDEQAKYYATEQYAKAKRYHEDEAADLLAEERFEPWYIELGAAEMITKRMSEELDNVVPHG